MSETDATVAVCRSENVNPSIQCGSKVLILDLGSKLNYWKVIAIANVHIHLKQ